MTYLPIDLPILIPINLLTYLPPRPALAIPTKGLPLADLVWPWAVALAAFCCCDCFSFESALLNMQRERMSKYKYHAME